VEPLTVEHLPLPKEAREKVVAQAKDVLDRVGWVTGDLINVKLNFKLNNDEAETEIAGYCAIGAMRQALSELGYASPWEWNEEDEDDSYTAVATAMGWGGRVISRITQCNDFHGREAAFAVIEQQL